MDDSTHCAIRRIKNDNMAESDHYRVRIKFIIQIRIQVNIYIYK